MKEMPLNTILTLPVRTYLRTMSGNAPLMYWSQPGHWRSANSCMVTGAFGSPRVFSFCGMPASSLLVAAADEMETVSGAALSLELSTLASTRMRAISPAAPAPPAYSQPRDTPAEPGGRGTDDRPLRRGDACASRCARMRAALLTPRTVAGSRRATSRVGRRSIVEKPQRRSRAGRDLREIDVHGDRFPGWRRR